jgi:predicted DCC family thiol-disulfide oxidoreductase YuxK
VIRVNEDESIQESQTGPSEPQCDQILYDGTCAICQRSVQFVNNRDNNQAFKLEPLEGGAAADTIIFRTADGVVYTKSAAAIQILKRLGPGWRILAGLLEVLPLSIRDSVYDWVARHRHL